LALAAGLGIMMALSPWAKADEFLLCPSGLDGVVGYHTSCPFADVVNSGYHRWGLHFNALSPVMNTWYQVNCDPEVIPVHFLGGAVNYGHLCYAGDGGEVVVW
jgi:hypothetical protein